MYATLPVLLTTLPTTHSHAHVSHIFTPSYLAYASYHKMIRSKAVTSCFASTSGGAQYLVAINVLRKCANCPMLLSAPSAADDDDDEVGVADVADGIASIAPTVSFADEPGAKLALLESLLEDISKHTDERVVVMSNSTQMLDRIAEVCARACYKTARLDGKTPTDSRMKIVDDFNSGVLEQFVFLLSTKAGGVGLNVVGASRLILFDLDWNPAHDLQVRIACSE